MRFHAIQHDVIPNNTDATEDRIEQLIQLADVDSGDFVVLPEMTTTGFSMDIDVVSQGDAVSWGCSQAKQFDVWLQIGWANQNGSRATNCISVCSPDGESIATYEKIFTCNPFGENDLIDQGNELVIIEINDRHICPLICYDLRFPELWRLATLSGADIFTNSANWPLKRIHSWTALLMARAIENQAQVIGANRVGEDEVETWGGSSIALSEEGITLAEADTLSETCVSATFEKESSQSWRDEFQAIQDTNRSLLGNIQVRHITP